jgi:anti-sigma factor RsiW
MNCDFSEKVSLLIDRELSPSEAEQITKHLTMCQVCQHVEQDFLGLRDQIKSYEVAADPIAQRQTLWKVLASQSIPLWRRKIAVPAPVFAFVLVALLALGAWSLVVRTTYQRPGQLDVRVSSVPAKGTANTEPGSMDLSRFDRGERATLYKERRSEMGAARGNGASQ